MSKGLNRAELLGNVGQDPELRNTSGGTAVLKLSIATEDSYKDKSGEWQKITDWHRVVIWGKRAAPLAGLINKGDKLYIEGKIKTRSYDKDGEKRYSTEIVASEVILCGGKGGGAAKTPAAPAPDQSGEYDDSEIPF
jgi:single-strand DNA-binding protein